MNASPSVPVALAVQLTELRARRPFLLDHVVRLVPTVARAAAFTDLGGCGIELLIEAPDVDAFTAWVAEIGRSDLVVSIRAMRDLAERSDGQQAAAVSAQYCEAQYVLSARALHLLATHPPELPREVVATEMWRLHTDTGRPLDSARWHVAWLQALGGGGPWPNRSDGSALLTARLAHGQWLRLTGGQPAHGAEIDTIDALISTHGPEPGVLETRPFD